MRSLDLSLTNCEIELDLSWSKDCVIPQMSKTPEVAANSYVNLPLPARPATQTSGTTFQINSTKVYVPAKSLSINNNINFLENLRRAFKRTISWNKSRSEMIM